MTGRVSRLSLIVILATPAFFGPFSVPAEPGASPGPAGVVRAAPGAVAAPPRPAIRPTVVRLVVRRAAAFDSAAPLGVAEVVSAAAGPLSGGPPDPRSASTPRGAPAEAAGWREPASPVEEGLSARQAAAVEQTSQGPRPPAVLLESFDGHGWGTAGPHGEGGGGNPSDNSMAVGPDHIVEIVNSRMAVYTRKGERYETTGRVLFGPIPTNVLFAGFGGECEARPNGDAVVRYDQLAGRWLYVMPLFRRAATVPPGRSEAPYGMCYALSAGPNPLGPYHRYYFERELFPDYPRPAVWPDGYYVPTSTGDNLLPDGSLPEKHACVVERSKMLQGLPAREQCIIIHGANFLNNADIDGPAPPPPGAPNIMMATGGTQLREDFEDDGIYWWKVHVDWAHPENTRAAGPEKIEVAPYHYLCDGQLTRCVPQPGTDTRLDAQGDKIMQRLVYRNVHGRESIVAVHSVNTSAGGGGVRWYEFRLDEDRDPVLYQQGTFAPDSLYRWMASPAMDRRGNIGIGYSFGGLPHYAGQRFAGRLADDPPGVLTFRETVLVEGRASQTSTLRWEDYTQASMDPRDDCTIWYVGDYLKEGAPSYTTRIGAFRFPGCLGGTVNGAVFFDRDHDGMRDPGEPGLPDREVGYRAVGRPGDRLEPPSGTLETTADGTFATRLPADPAYFDPTWTLSSPAPDRAAWTRTGGGVAYGSDGAVSMAAGGYTLRLRDRDDVVGVDFGDVCVVPNTGGAGPERWAAAEGRATLTADDRPLPEEGGRGRRGGGFGRGRAGDAGWRAVVNLSLHLVSADGSRFRVSGSGPFEDAWGQLAAWLREPEGLNASRSLSARLAATALAVAYGDQSGEATVHDPVADDWPTVAVLVDRVSRFVAGHPDTPPGSPDRGAAASYDALLRDLNANILPVTPPGPERCPDPF